jgi:hypothetical protein
MTSLPHPSLYQGERKPNLQQCRRFDSGRGLDERRTAGVHNAGIRNYSG